jgi:uncharacterized protein (TIGR02466 family)
MRVREAIPNKIVDNLIRVLDRDVTERNSRSEQLSHTTVCAPGENEEFSIVDELVKPRLVDFGSLIFGEDLDWTIKEMWLNRLEQGGFQSVHSHANSFISGVVYLTKSHPSARTVFYKHMGGREFAFTNEHRNAKMGPFNAPKWAVPETDPGDLVLFPSYLLHEVPRNEGQTRMTLALNAVPSRLKSWDYELGFV